MSELLHQFGVDWKLLLAQAINFFVLLAVLWKFAYGPILAMLRKRRDAIVQGLDDARAAGERLASAERAGSATIAAAREEALGIVNQAEVLGKKRKEEIVQEAGHKGESILADARRAGEEERRKSEEAFYKDAEGLLRAGLEKVLAGMSPEARDRALIAAAVTELKSAPRR